MGYADAKDVFAFLAAVEQVLASLGYKATPGAGCWRRDGVAAGELV